MKTGIIFDLDGTLMDSLTDIHISVNYMLSHFGLPAKSRDEVRRLVGNGARNLVRRALPGKDTDPSLEEALAVYMEHYDANCTRNTFPYAGIPALLEKLKTRCPMAIVSNKPHSSVTELCRVHFPGLYALGTVPELARKPAPDMVFRAMEVIGVDRCIYVGDSEVDIETARNAGARCVSVLWGFRDRRELEQAGGTCFCERVEDLLCLLETLPEA